VKFVAAHLRKEGVAQDDESPRLDRGAAFEARTRRPRLDHRVLRQIVGKIGIARQAAPISAQMRDDASEKRLEFAVRQAVIFLRTRRSSRAGHQSLGLF
jgi:hypothetical protein